MPKEKSAPLQGVMTVADAAGVLGMSTRRVRALCAAGRLVGRRVGRDWAVSAVSVAKYRPSPAGRPAQTGRK